MGAALTAAPLLCGAAMAVEPTHAADAQVIFLGEQHDNPAHHWVQAEWVEALQPTALVFEMLTEAQAAAIMPEIRNDMAAIATATDWANAGWPDFEMYAPIFQSAPETVVFGAGVPRRQVRGLMQADIAEVAGAERAARFGLEEPLPEAQQAAREALQKAAHCDALPDEMLPMMVSVQRLRDVVLADTALAALDATGGPVVVITGNGHARTDWGAPHYVSKAAPEVRVFALGQGEAGKPPEGDFAAVVDGPAVDRGDPCDALR